MARKTYDRYCLDCNTHWDDFAYYMVHDTVWVDAADPNTLLCLKRLPKRLDRGLTSCDFPVERRLRGSLWPVPVNVTLLDLRRHLAQTKPSSLREFDIFENIKLEGSVPS